MLDDVSLTAAACEPMVLDDVSLTAVACEPMVLDDVSLLPQYSPRY